MRQNTLSCKEEYGIIFLLVTGSFFAIKKREGCIRGMKAGKGSQGVAAVCMLVIGAAVAYGSGPVYQKIQSAGQGTPVDISGKNSGAYQVEGVWKKSDDSYMVHASAQGFQSEIQMEVLFDASGEQIQQVKVLAQGDRRNWEQDYRGQFCGNICRGSGSSPDKGYGGSVSGV